MRLRAATCVLTLALAWSASGYSLQDIKTVFVIVMENQPWVSIKGNPSCPYINNTLLPQAAWCEHYSSPPNLHPTLPNYLWLVAGTNFGLYWNPSPWEGVQDTTNHLAFLLDRAGISWKHYQMGLENLSYPQTNIVFPYHTAFNPFLYFRNVLTNTAYGEAHIRPYTEFESDLTNGSVARLNFISPGLWWSMHDSGPPGGDQWLATEVPKIMASPAYRDRGALFITWDEDDFGWPQRPIGMMVLSPLGKLCYSNNIPYTHSSTLRTLQNIFGVFPYLGDAANAADLSDLFKLLRLTPLVRSTNGLQSLHAENAMPDKTYYLDASTNLASGNWQTVSTNVAATNELILTHDAGTNQAQRFYRLKRSP